MSTSAALITTVNTTLSRWKTITSVCAVQGPAVPMDALHNHRQPNNLGARIYFRSRSGSDPPICCVPSLTCMQLLSPSAVRTARDLRPQKCYALHSFESKLTLGKALSAGIGSPFATLTRKLHALSASITSTLICSAGYVVRAGHCSSYRLQGPQLRHAPAAADEHQPCDLPIAPSPAPGLPGADP